MKALLLSMIFVLSACTSAPKRISKEVNDVKDQDFKKVKQSRYKKSADVLSDVKSKYSDVSNRESIDRVYKYDGDVELSGPMAKVAKLCYAKNFKLADKIV